MRKKSIAASSSVGEFDTSTTTCAPERTSASPSPVNVLTPVDESRKIAEAIPGARLDVIPGAGHLSNLEQPERFNAVLGAFLASL